MSSYLGIDLGTSSIKGLAIDDSGKILATFLAIFAKFAQEGIDKLPAFYKKVIQPIDYLYPNEVNVKKYNQLFQSYQKFVKFI